MKNKRFDNFKKARYSLSKAVELSETRSLSELEQQGLIKAFEYTYELAWNVMKDFYGFQGGSEKIQGSRDAIRMASQSGLIENGKVWMEMVESRIETVHGYDQTTAEYIVGQIIKQYHVLFQKFEMEMQNRLKNAADN